MSLSAFPLCCSRQSQSPSGPQGLDLVLILDRSASMAGERFSAMRRGVRLLLAALPRDARAGLIAFSRAAAGVPLAAEPDAVLRAIDRLSPQGPTHYGAAFSAAAAMFNENSLRRQVVLLCTDGETDCGRDTADAVHLLRKKGVEVFCIGLTASTALLSDWCGTPVEDHLLTADCPQALTGLFAQAGALIFGHPISPAPGESCPSRPVCPEKPSCPELPNCVPIPVAPKRCTCCLPACKSCGVIQLPPVDLCGQGRIVYLNVTLRDVCPGRRIALAVQLWECGPCGREESRGVQCFTVPAQEGEGCRDITVKCIPFVLPEDLNPDCCDCCNCHSAQCRERCFLARVLANYVDSDVIDCCGVTTRL